MTTKTKQVDEEKSPYENPRRQGDKDHGDEVQEAKTEDKASTDNSATTSVPPAR